ncbi:MAG TPA: NADH-ubiquinone oxidoreductase-F iron-sulfur binding region domain-containing protein [Streptosporangiaceae bacterium]|nr:NADH-ubiquinone oxidoreductase-F iron-sulfur binding region domain-containing protein [Streptosporangiaceae bacterium]
MSSLSLPQVMRVGQARLTAGLDRFGQLDMATHREVFGAFPQYTAVQLADMAGQVDLRGRGGAGFPFYRKLQAVLDSVRTRHRQPVVVINGTEGEPGSAKDKLLLVRSPYLVLGGALIVARALDAYEVVVAVAEGGAAVAPVTAAVRADPQLRRLVRVAIVPEKFVSGESSALVSSVNGNEAVPPGRKTRTSVRGVRGRPTLLANAETFAQVGVLALLGPHQYASTGTDSEPGTTLLTVGGSATRPAVVEVPFGLALGDVLDMCGASECEAVLVGGYHGAWLPGGAAMNVPVSRAGMAAAGGALGAGIVLPLSEDTCPLGEVTAVAWYLAGQSTGQCGPCKLGLPQIAQALSSVLDGSGGMAAMDAARRMAAAVRGRGACSHPDGTATFVLSALDVFTHDLAAHVFGNGCRRPVRGELPLPSAPGSLKLELDWTRCEGHGLCGRIVPELIRLDNHGYPVLMDMTVPSWLEPDARQAVAMCPALALRLGQGAAPRPAPTTRRLAIGPGSAS